MDHHDSVTGDGLRLPRAATALEGPKAFDPGPRGVFHEITGQEYAEKMERPIWYVLRDDAGGITQGSIIPGDTSRTMVVQVGVNPDEHTHLYVYGRLKDGVSSRSVYEVFPVAPAGTVVWRSQINTSRGDEWHIDVCNDGSSFAWVIREDPDHAEVGLVHWPAAVLCAPLP